MLESGPRALSLSPGLESSGPGRARQLGPRAHQEAPALSPAFTAQAPAAPALPRRPRTSRPAPAALFCWGESPSYSEAAAGIGC